MWDELGKTQQRYADVKISFHENLIINNYFTEDCFHHTNNILLTTLLNKKKIYFIRCLFDLKM